MFKARLQTERLFKQALAVAQDGINKANTAQNMANTAQNTANSATTKANTAQNTANSATTKANTAQTTANSATTKANTAQNTADGKLNKGSKAVDSNNLDGLNTSFNANGNTIPYRDGSGDIRARLFRSDYAEQTTPPPNYADIAFRNNAHSDNYTRFMSAEAFRGWLQNIGVATSHRAISSSLIGGSTSIGASQKAVRDLNYAKLKKIYNVWSGQSTSITNSWGKGIYLLKCLWTGGRKINVFVLITGDLLTSNEQHLVGETSGATVYFYGSANSNSSVRNKITCNYNILEIFKLEL